MSACEALSDARSWVRTGGGPLCLISLFAGGHVLLTDIPGVDKTTFVRAISSSSAADLSRIRFTSDLLPS
ncbi:MAG TPA: AAA family ATPase [Rubrobacteraceae bacterium]|nr:AAA family ATPase [Rubrobacteraceae bacterium]